MTPEANTNQQEELLISHILCVFLTFYALDICIFLIYTFGLN